MIFWRAMLGVSVAACVGMAYVAWPQSHPHGLRVIDGDTYELVAEDENLRLRDWDTPEVRTGQACQKALGEAAKKRARELLVTAEIVAVEFSGERGWYGRPLVVIEVDGVDIGALLAAEGLARRYRRGQTGKGWC